MEHSIILPKARPKPKSVVASASSSSRGDEQSFPKFSEGGSSSSRVGVAKSAGPSSRSLGSRSCLTLFCGLTAHSSQITWNRRAKSQKTSSLWKSRSTANLTVTETIKRNQTNPKAFRDSASSWIGTSVWTALQLRDRGITLSHLTVSGSFSQSSEVQSFFWRQ